MTTPKTHPVTPTPAPASPPTTVPIREGYDRWSPIYDDDANPLILLEEPALAALLPSVDQTRIADIGCGTGRHAIRLARDGADVTALDFSDGMLETAMQKPGADLVRFVRHDITAPLPLDDNAFDHVLCCLVLDHITHLTRFFGELARICRPDGAILATVMHPAMNLRGVTARFDDPETGAKTHVQSETNQISDYVSAARDASLRIDHIAEHACDEPTCAKSPRAERYLDWPMLLVMRLTKPT